MGDMRTRFTSVATRLLDEDPRLAVVTAVIGRAAFEESGARRRHPDRVLDVGIREQTMIGVAAGMALEGLRPIAHSYVPFLIERPFEQLKLDFSHQGVGGILVSVGASHDWPTGGRTHMAPGDVAAVATLPGWTIHVPGHPDEVEAHLRAEARNDGPVYIRLSSAANRVAHAGNGPEITAVRRGTPAAPTVLAVGPMLDPVLAAMEGVDATVAYTSTVRPLDAAGLHRLVGGTDVIAVEPYLEGTSVGPIASALSDRPHRLLAIGIGPEELRKYGTSADHDRAWGLDADSLHTRITNFIHRPGAGWAVA
jgi:transketolase